MTVLRQDAVAVPHGDFAAELDIVDHPVRRQRGWLMRRLLAAADIVGLLCAYVVALVLTPSEVFPDKVSGWWEIGLFAASLPLWLLLFRIHGLYDRDEEHTDHSTVDDIVDVFQAVTLGTWSFLVLTSILGLPHPSLERLLEFWLIAVVLVPLVRAVARSIGRRQHAYMQNVIIVGSGKVARLVEDKIRKHPEYGLRVTGFVDGHADAPSETDSPGKIGVTDDLPYLVRAYGVARVVIAFSTDSHERTLAIIRSLQDCNVQVDIVPRMFEVLAPSAQLHTIEGLPLVGLPVPRLSGSSKFLKRSFDLVVATVGVVLLAPLFVGLAVWIKLDSRGPVFFRQVRMGAGGQPFRIFKLRTMVADADAKKAQVAHLNMHSGRDPRMFKVPDDPRVTRAGRFLRRSRLDELPQLFNVVTGEMSLVGPRPLILDEDQHVADWARRRLDLKPGITGLWQVLGASDIPFDEMTMLDYRYVTNWSLREDLRLILLTVPSITRSRAAY